MPLLAGTLYDPGTLVPASSQPTSSLLAMTAIDTTNLRLSFVVPASGNVVVKLRVTTTGATTLPTILLGVLEGATVRMRMAPEGIIYMTGVATSLLGREAVGLVTGLTPGANLTWDAAYAVQVVVASTGITYGGPNDATGADAAGGVSFEIWDSANLLAGTLYDPSSAATKATTALRALTALDTTNLRLTFTAPASGNVWFRIRGAYTGQSTTPGSHMLGILESTTVIARSAALASQSVVLAAGVAVLEFTGTVAVGAGSHTWDAAYATQVVSGASGAFKYGGPNNTTGNNAWGGFAFEVWTA